MHDLWHGGTVLLAGQPLAAAGGSKVDPGASPQQQLMTGKHVDLSKLTLEQLERLKEKAREKQWEDEWWKLYQKKEDERREKVAASYRSKEKTTISMYNMTLTRWVDVLHVELLLEAAAAAAVLAGKALTGALVASSYTPPTPAVAQHQYGLQ
jgi:hypothetical protein